MIACSNLPPTPPNSFGKILAVIAALMISTAKEATSPCPVKVPRKIVPTDSINTYAIPARKHSLNTIAECLLMEILTSKSCSLRTL